MARTATLPVLNGEHGLSRYLAEIRKFPMLEPQQEYMFAKRWREHDDRDAAHHLVTSHLRLVAKIAMGYRGYGLPISEVVSEGNVGLMQAVKRVEADRGFRLGTPPRGWTKASGSPPTRFGVSRPRSSSTSCARARSSKWAPPRTRRSCSSTCARQRARSPHWTRAICTPTR